MSSPSDPVELLVEQERLRRKIADLDALPPETAPWWQPGRRRAAAQAMVKRAADRAKYVDRLGKLGDLTDKATTVAKDCIDEAWRSHRNDGDLPWRHPYALDALDNLTMAASAVCVSARSEIPGTDVFASDLPSVAEAITVETIEAFVRERVSQAHAVATDPRMLTREFATDTGGQGLDVQHQESGLRVRFFVTEGIGRVYAQSYRIPTLDPAFPDPDPELWERWSGLGIGTQIYRRAARAFPGARWPSGNPQDPAVGVRRKLHREDPWRWEDKDCAWCRENLPDRDWRAAPRAVLEAHPRTESSQ